MIIELFGLPGVGKSTYARSLASESGYVCISINKKRAVVWWCLVAAIFSPTIFFRHLAWCLKQDSSRFYVWNFFCIRMAKYAKASLATGTVLLDEGPLQNLLSYPSEKMNTASVDRFLATVPTAHNIIALTVDETERQRRLQQRPYQSWRQKSDSSIDYDSIMKHNHDALVATMSLKKSFSCVDNT